MANRQIPTTLFDDSWFYELSNEAKLLFFHIYLKSDHAGIIDMIPRRIEYDLQIDFKSAFLQVEPLLIQISGMRYILPLVLFTQFPNGLDSTHKFQGSVLRTLTNNGLDYEDLKYNKALPKPLLSLSEALPKAHSISNSQSISQGNSNSSGNSHKAKVEKKSDYESWINSGSDGKTEVRPYVWLDESELEKLTAKYGDAEKLNTAIEEVSASKANRNNKRPTKFNYELHFTNSYQVLNAGWAWKNHLARVEAENRVKASENFLQVSESRLNGNNPQNKAPETSFNPKTEQSTYDKKIMQPKPSFIVSESGRKIYLNWESLINLDGWPDCKFPAVSGETKLKHLSEIDKQAYCSFFQIEIESLKPRN